MAKTHSAKSPKNDPQLGRRMLDWLHEQAEKGNECTVHDFCDEFGYKFETMRKWGSENNRISDKTFIPYYKTAIECFHGAYRPEYAGELIRLMRDEGYTFAMVASKWGVDTAHFQRWKEYYPIFARAYRIAAVGREAYLDREIQQFDVAEEGKAASAWMQSRMKLHHNHTNSGKHTFHNSGKAKEVKLEHSGEVKSGVVIYMPDNGREDTDDEIETDE